MLSPIGKVLRQLRLEKDERLMDMAERLDVSSSFLSAVEMGRKAPPRDFPERVIQIYRLPAGTVQDLRMAAAASQKVYKIEALNALARSTAGLLAESFPDLDEAQLSDIQKIVRRNVVDD